MNDYHPNLDGPAEPVGLEMDTSGQRPLAPVSGSKTVFTNYHFSQSIRGPLMNWKQSDWMGATKYITRNDGSHFTVGELKMQFLDELAKGHEVVPLGECDNFDWKTGCQGHAPKSSND